MIIDVNLIKRQGKSEEDFCLEYTPHSSLIDLPGAEFLGNVTVKGRVFLLGKKAVVEGTISYVLKGECSRCLEPASAKVEEELFAEFSLESGAEFPIKAGKIDLTAITEETVMTSCPMVIYCSEDCKGICPGCGVNLNRQQCKCKN